MQKSKTTSGYSVPNVLSLCKHFITLTAVPGLHPSTSEVWSTCMGPLPTGTYINSLERVQKFALKVCTKNMGVYVSVMQPAHPCQQKTVYETVLTLSNCQWTSKFPYCTHSTTKPVQISQKHQYTLALEWPVTCMNASIFPHTITLWNSLPPHVYKTSSHCVPLNKLYFVAH